jgi:uncharacterized BrkB/YihY/UPF0761 family membrane protein
VEDRGSWVGSLISYYGFFSLFPLLVVFVTVATWVLEDRPELLQDLLQAVWSRVPFLASTLQNSVEREVQKLDGNVWVMICGWSSCCGEASAWPASSKTPSTGSGGWRGFAVSATWQRSSEAWRC